MRVFSYLTVLFVLAALAIASAPVLAAPPLQSVDSTDLASVDSISIGGVGTVALRIGSPASMTISGPDSIMDALSIVVTNDELEIEPASDESLSLDEDEDLHFDLTVESIDDIRLRGAVKLEAAGIQSSELDIELEGSSTATLTGLVLEELDVRLEGASLLTAAGSTSELDIEAHESSTFDGSALTAASADVSTFDASLAVVNVTGSLDVEARSASTVEYVGTPASTDFEMSEAGTIRPFSGMLTATPAAATPGASPAAATAAEVHLAGRTFTPSTIELTVGDELTWINDDDSPHTVTSLGGPFESGTLEEGMTFSFTFDTTGSFDYICAIHPEMRGTVVVN